MEQNNSTQTGLERIEQIKNEITKCKPSPKFCKTNVYEMWDGCDCDENK